MLFAVVLSSEQFEKIVGMAAPADEAEPAGLVLPAGARKADRRQATRIPFGHRAKIYLEHDSAGGVWDTVMVQDISVQGVSLVSGQWLEVDGTFVLLLKDRNDQPVHIRCTVRRSEQGGFGGVSYIVGAIFEQVLEPADVQRVTHLAHDASHSNADGAMRLKRRVSQMAHDSGSLIGKLNPLRMFSRRYDDFATYSNGFKLPETVAQELESASAAHPSTVTPGPAAQTPPPAVFPTRVSQSKIVRTEAEPTLDLAQLSEVLNEAQGSAPEAEVELEEVSEPAPVEEAPPLEEALPADAFVSAGQQEAVDEPLPESSSEPLAAPIDPAPLTPAAAETQFNFTSKSLPAYLRKPKTLDELLPWLALQGVVDSQLSEAIGSLGFDAASFGPAERTQSRQSTQEEFETWTHRSLASRRYAYLWADGLHLACQGAGPNESILMMIGAGEDGKKELIALETGDRHNEKPWRKLLLDLMKRGLTKPPKLVIGDGKLALWKPLAEFSPTTRRQRCWTYQMAQVLSALPKRQHPHAKSSLHEICVATKRADALKALNLFAQFYQEKFPQAANSLLEDKESLLAFYDFPAEHWSHLRSCGPVEQIFESVLQNSITTTRPIGAAPATLADVYKLAAIAEKRGRRLNASPLVAEVLRGTPFIDGEKRAA